MLELYNLNYSEDIAQFSNLTHDIVATFRKITLNREPSRIVRRMFKGGIGREGKTSTSYSKKDASVDIFSLADKLIYNSLVK